MTQLTPHFSLADYVNSDTAIRMGIRNEPPEALVPNLQHHAMVMEMIRAALSKEKGRDVPIFISSGYRCEQLERIIANKDYMAWCKRHNAIPSDASWAEYFARKGHPKGNCGDWVAPSFGTPKEIVAFISSKPELMRLIDQIIEEGTWVHTATTLGNPRGMVMKASFNADGEPSYSVAG